jgi:Zn ribbon nucleic-acid-binding protein
MNIAIICKNMVNNTIEIKKMMPAGGVSHSLHKQYLILSIEHGEMGRFGIYHLIQLIGGKKLACPLCEFEFKTKVHYNDNFVTIVDCINCGTPMFVGKGKSFHKPNWPNKEEQKFYEKLSLRITGLTKIRRERRVIKDHYHFHLE